jgi:predicted transcriptional regulator
MTIEFRNLGDMESDLLALPKTRKPQIQPKNVVYFDSLGSFRSFMTIQKLEILTLIANADPRSVYELAKMLGRAIAPVQKDCQSLEAAGFIGFKKEKGGRKTLTPKLVFNYDRILVRLPEHPYELQFSSAA